MTTIPADASDAGATNTPNPGRSATGSGQDDSGDLRARLACLVRQPFKGWVSSPTEAYAIAVADAILAAGYRLAVEDDTTIDRVARAIHHAECGYDDLCKGYDSHGEWDRKWREDSYEAAARAAVRAIREAGVETGRCQGCGGPLSDAGTA